MLRVDETMLSSERIHQPSFDTSLSGLTSYTTSAARLTVDITVVIPTYNGSNRLPQIFEALRAQTQTQPFTWELIVCDNNSIDDTASTVKHHQQTWPSHSPLRYCFAAEQGAAFARQRAVEAAKGELIAFLDDDNIPAVDWIDNVYSFAQEHPEAGAFGSQIHGEFEGPVPDGFDKISCFLAIIERGGEPHLYNPKTKILPPAAGLVVRREAWQGSVPRRLFLNNKGKEAGLASEDLEALLYIQKAGWEIWYNPEMVVTHQIPKSRLRQEYLVSLFRCVGLSRYYIRLLGTKDWLCPFLIPAYIANDLRKLALHRLRYRHHLNLVQSCEREHLASTVASPLFLLKKTYQDWCQDRFDRAHLPGQQLWLNRLTDAFEQEQFEIYRQRVESVDALGTLQFELLLRITTGESVSSLPQHIFGPNHFLPVAERYGLTLTIDRWVIRKFFQSIKQSSPERLPILSGQSSSLFSINLSTASVCDPSLPSFIADQFEQSSLSPQLVCFEIHASTMLAYPEKTVQLITSLNHFKCQIAIDNLHLAQTKNSVLQTLPVNYLKLSQKLTQTVDQDIPTLHRTQSLIEWAHQQGLMTVATGIENRSQLQHIKQVGIDFVQGYGLEAPVPFKL